jgi:PhoH-like ATPase
MQPEPTSSETGLAGIADTLPIVVLDTCVLLTDPDSLFAYPDSEVVLPLTVIEELDGHKSRMDEVGRAARVSVRTIERVRRQNGGNLLLPAPLRDGAFLRIETNGLMLDRLEAAALDPDKADNRILAAALGLMRAGRPVRVISQDAALRVKASQLALEADEYVANRRVDQSSTLVPVEATDQAVSILGSGRGVSCAEAFEYAEVEPVENMGVVLRSPSGGSALGRVIGDGLEPLRGPAEVWGLRPRSKEQRFALDLLCDPNVPIVSIAGEAGPGKTILALAAALEQVFEPPSEKYDRLMILRPVVSVGRQDIGFLPGGLEDKLGPWFEAIIDAMVSLSDGAFSHKQARQELAAWVHDERLTLESVTFLRGRSLQRTLVIVDEAQNLEPLTAKTILTRMGEGTKVVLLGDTSQIDSPWLSESSNALAAVVEACQGDPLFGHVTLTKGERSPAAALAARVM